MSSPSKDDVEPNNNDVTMKSLEGMPSDMAAQLAAMQTMMEQQAEQMRAQQEALVREFVKLILCRIDNIQPFIE